MYRHSILPGKAKGMENAERKSLSIFGIPIATVIIAACVRLCSAEHESKYANDKVEQAKERWASETKPATTVTHIIPAPTVSQDPFNNLPSGTQVCFITPWNEKVYIYAEVANDYYRLGYKLCR